jgi:hypothetical protein
VGFRLTFLVLAKEEFGGSSQSTAAEFRYFWASFWPRHLDDKALDAQTTRFGSSSLSTPVPSEP